MRDAYFSWGTTVVNKDYFDLVVEVPFNTVANFSNIHDVPEGFKDTRKLFELKQTNY